MLVNSCYLTAMLQVDILEHKETQLKGTERRVHTFEQQVEQLQTELSRCSAACIELSCSNTLFGMNMCIANLAQAVYASITCRERI